MYTFEKFVSIVSHSAHKLYKFCVNDKNIVIQKSNSIISYLVFKSMWSKLSLRENSDELSRLSL